TILAWDDERLDHLGGEVVAVKLIEFVQPEVITGIIQHRLRRIVGIAAQVSEVLHQHKRAIELLLLYQYGFSHVAQRPSARVQIESARPAEFIDRLCVIRSRMWHAGVVEHLVDKLCRTHSHRKCSSEAWSLHEL